MTGGIEPVEPWHAEVHQDHMRPERFCDFNGFHAVMSSSHLIAQEYEQHRKALCAIAVVIDHENPAMSVGLRR